MLAVLNKYDTMSSQQNLVVIFYVLILGRGSVLNMAFFTCVAFCTVVRSMGRVRISNMAFAADKAWHFVG